MHGACLVALVALFIPRIHRKTILFLLLLQESNRQDIKTKTFHFQDGLLTTLYFFYYAMKKPSKISTLFNKRISEKPLKCPPIPQKIWDLRNCPQNQLKGEVFFRGGLTFTVMVFYALYFAGAEPVSVLWAHGTGWKIKSSHADKPLECSPVGKKAGDQFRAL